MATLYSRLPGGVPPDVEGKVGPPPSQQRWRRQTPLGVLVSAFLLLSLFFSLGGMRSNDRLRALGMLRDCQQKGGVARDRFECEVRRTRKEFRAWLRGQSRTLGQAKRRYAERYGRQAPVWFDSWYEYARRNEVPFIDEFDQLELDLAPLRQAAPAVLRARMAAVSQQHGAELGEKYLSLLRIKEGKVLVQLPWADGAVQALRMILDPIAHLLPDLSILVNFGDEPYVRKSDPQPWTTEIQRWEVDVSENVNVTTRPCPSSNTLDLQSGARRLLAKSRHSICNSSHSAFLASHHGRFQDGIREYNLTFPILSTAKGPVHQDILFPMRGYQYASTQGSFDSVPWHEKWNSVYWRGSASGQVNTKGNWRTSHRSRWVLNAQFWDLASREMSRLSGKAKRRAQSILLQNGQASEMAISEEALQALDRLPSGSFNVSFTAINFCLGDEGCNMLRKVTAETARMPPDEGTRHKFVFDLDGLGMSERYYWLLLTRSVVLKQTEWAEWHDEYLIPWVHYVPISLELEEVPELLDFLINDPFGRTVAERISQEAAPWILSSLSIKAQSAYLLRTLYEYADIMNA